MLKINIEDCHDSNEGHLTMEISGSVKTIVAELALVVVQVYRSFEKSDPDEADMFRALVSEVFSDHGCWDIPLPKVHGESVTCAIPYKKED